MKKNITFILLISVFILINPFLSCRKKELVGVKIIDKPTHCYNNILDFDEKIVDGGGSCGCDSTKLINNCLLNKNQIKLENIIYKVNFLKRDTFSDGQINITYSFNNTDRVFVRIQPNVLLNQKLWLWDGPVDSSQIDIEVYTLKYDKFNLNGINGTIKILSDGCSTRLMTCDTYIRVPTIYVDCIMDIELNLF